MPPGDGILADPDDLDAHARHVDAVARTLGLLASAAATTSADPGAYGRLLTALPLALGYADGVVGQALSDAGDAVTATADKVRTSAARYRTADAAVEERVASVRAALGDGP